MKAVVIGCGRVGSSVAKALHESFMRRIVANFDNEWELSSADLDEAVAALRSGQAA